MQHQDDPTSRSRGRSRLRAWLLRYAPLEAAAWAGALMGGKAAWSITPQIELLALGAVLGELLAYYGLALLREVRGRPRDLRGALRELLDEFGLAEGMDTIIVRPLMIGGATLLFPPPIWSVLLGGLAADLVFYAAVALNPSVRGRLASESSSARNFV